MMAPPTQGGTERRRFPSAYDELPATSDYAPLCQECLDSLPAFKPQWRLFTHTLSHLHSIRVATSFPVLYSLETVDETLEAWEAASATHVRPAMSDNELFYLEPGFDLNSLTVPRLRSILVEHDIAYPASSKKPDLIRIVKDEVLVRSQKLLKARARTKRTSRGITDVPSSQEGTEVGDDVDDGDLMPPPKTPRSRKSKSTLTEDDPTTTRARTAGRKSTAKHPRQSDTETDADPQPAVRKSRKSTPGPVPVASTPVTIAEPVSHVKRESLEAVESPFSDENIFQKGSSPLSDTRRVSSSRARKSLGTSSDRKKSTSRRRQTASPHDVKQEDGFTAPSRSTFEFPVPVTEEFIPEETLDLELERASGQLVQRPASTMVRQRKQPSNPAVTYAPWTIILILTALLANWWRVEKINVGYCGVGEPQWSLAQNDHMPPVVHEYLQPQCESCPQHAVCHPNMQVTCDDNYVLTNHPLNPLGIWPIPPTCEPDGEKQKRVKAVADKAVDQLRQRRAAFECGELVTSTAEPSSPIDKVKTIVKSEQSKLEVPEATLKADVGRQRRKDMTDAEFEDLWRSAIGDVVGRDEVSVAIDGSGRTVLSSSSLAQLPLVCTVRRSVRLAISRHRSTFSFLVVLLGASIYTWQRITSYQQATVQIPSLVATTLDRLATQAALKEDERVAEAFISVGQLRDDVLRNVFSKRERERVWRGVAAVVEENSNVRAATREGGKTGEWSRVWEWIGPVNLAPGLEGRRSGGLLPGEPSTTPDGAVVPASEGQVRKWNEGRPIY